MLGKHPYAYAGRNFNAEYGTGLKNATKNEYNKFLKQSNFNVGEPDKANKFYSTQYNVDHPERDIKEALSGEFGPNAFLSSIKMNGRQHAVQPASQNTTTYLEQSMDAAKKDMTFEKYLRANHFSIGHSPKAAPEHYKSIQVKSFDSKKGEYSRDPDRANFVQATHFTVGNEGAPSVTA